jgi:5-methylcytosine-specific restriction endonuclease McrA
VGRTKNLKEWVGRNDDTAIPDYIRERITSRASDCCQACGLRVRYGGQIDHVIALANWNPTPEAPHGNRQSNLQLLCGPCHTAKTRKDVAEKAETFRKRKRLGPLQAKQSAWSKRYQEAKAKGFDPWRR